MLATMRNDAKRCVIKPVTPKTACTMKTMRKASRRFEVVATKLSAPTRIKNAPSEATMLMAWSAKNERHENTWRGSGGFAATGGAATSTLRGALAMNGTDAAISVGAIATCGAFADAMKGGATGAFCLCNMRRRFW